MDKTMLFSRSSGLWPRLAVGFGLTLGLLCAPGAAVAQSKALHRIDPAMVNGPNACGECHKSSVSVWKLTRHAKTFKELPRAKKAKAITKKMGLKRIKSASDCLTCHFTSAVVKGKVKPIAGISCESCHGGGKNWITEHQDFGGKGTTAENEDPAHRVARYAKSEAAGMIRPVRLYDVAANCYGCHTVPNEKLVNVGGHPAGSRFDLVAWSQGEVRHNVWYTRQNDEAALERKRMMYIVGKALDLEFALRGVAKATGKIGEGKNKLKYAKAMARRAAAAKKAMLKIGAAISAPEIKEINDAAAGAKLKLNNDAELSAAADKISAAARTFAASHDGSAFGAVDAMIPAADKYKGKPAP